MVETGKTVAGYFEEHRLVVKNLYKKFGFTAAEAAKYSSYKLLEIAVCRGWITVRWGTAADHGEKDNDNIFIRLSTVTNAGERLSNLLRDILEARGDTKLFIEEYGNTPFINPPQSVYSGTLEGFLDGGA